MSTIPPCRLPSQFGVRLVRLLAGRLGRGGFGGGGVGLGGDGDAGQPLDEVLDGLSPLAVEDHRQQLAVSLDRPEPTFLLDRNFLDDRLLRDTPLYRRRGSRTQECLQKRGEFPWGADTNGPRLALNGLYLLSSGLIGQGPLNCVLSRLTRHLPNQGGGTAAAPAYARTMAVGRRNRGALGRQPRHHLQMAGPEKNARAQGGASLEVSGQ